MPSSDALLPQTAERRAFVRYARRLETLWNCLGLHSEDLAGGKVLDLSASGVGLRLTLAIAPGTSLMLRLQSATRGWASYLVKVRHCQELSPGEYHLGCVFIKPLTAVQLQELLLEPTS